MPSSRGCRSSYDCIVKIKGVTTRPILFGQLMRGDGEGGDEPRGAGRILGNVATPPVNST